MYTDVGDTNASNKQASSAILLHLDFEQANDVGVGQFLHDVDFRLQVGLVLAVDVELVTVDALDRHTRPSRLMLAEPDIGKGARPDLPHHHIFADFPLRAAAGRAGARMSLV